MYGNLTPDLAYAKFNDRLANAEARRLAAAARQTRPWRPRSIIPAVLRVPRLRQLNRRPTT